MMLLNMEYMELGPTPCDEDCAQLGTDGYRERARKEAQAYIRQLVRIHGEPPAYADFATKWFNHEFGQYCEVVIKYDEDNDEAREYAYKVESNLPPTWDKVAEQELQAVIV